MNGSNQYLGQIEVWYSSMWAAVCDDSWDMTDASVVCRQLGWGNAVSALGSVQFGRGSGTLWLDDINCNGLERVLSECSLRAWGECNCGHDEVAGVLCSGEDGVCLICALWAGRAW